MWGENSNSGNLCKQVRNKNPIHLQVRGESQTGSKEMKVTETYHKANLGPIS